MRTTDLSREQLAILVLAMWAKIEAQKNHIASAVERPENWRAPLDAATLVKELRVFEELHLILNGALRKASPEKNP